MKPQIDLNDEEAKAHLRQINNFLSHNKKEDEKISFVYEEEIIHIKLTSEFLNAFELLENNNSNVFITGKAGCLGKGTKVLMFDGEFKRVENIKVGDRLMGIDSTPRHVTSLCRGKEQMYWVHQNKGNSYRVNESHILSLKHVIPAKKDRVRLPNGKRERILWSNFSEKKIETLNITVKDYLNLSKGSIKRKHSKGYKSGLINFKESPLLIDPYYLGLWLGDGHTNEINRITNFDLEIIEYLKNNYNAIKLGNSKSTYSLSGQFTDDFKYIFSLKNAHTLERKYIPRSYLFNSKENRIKLLAGLIDSDGSYDAKGKQYEITIANEKLANNITYLTRSLGFATTLKKVTKKCTNCRDNEKQREAWRIRFTSDLEIPVLLERKKQKLISNFKNRLHTGIKIEKDVVDDYYGFELDGDHLFILEDFTVTHNTGKSTLMKYFKSRTKKQVATVAFTGLAAINVKGVTIHSFFHFPLGFIRNVPTIDEMKPIFRTLDTIIVDEVSMCRADIIDAMDKSLRLHRMNNEPFGGVQMIFIGDLYQLPPIIEEDLKEIYGRHYATPFFFDAKVFKNKYYPVINLEKIHRQSDQTFIDILNNVRERKNVTATLNQLNVKVNPSPKGLRENNTIVICTTNDKVRSINNLFLSKLTTPLFSYQATIKGTFDELSFPTNKTLDLKQGAKVIFVKNDKFKSYVNGDVGIVTRLSPSEIHVQTRTGQIILHKEEWEKIKYKKVVSKDEKGNEIAGTERIEKEVIGTFKQYPIKLAWAITIHKSQGQTYDSVLIDFDRGCFTSGQAYVALSRCRTFEGLTLKRPVLAEDIIVDSRIHNYTKVFNNEAAKFEDGLEGSDAS